MVGSRQCYEWSYQGIVTYRNLFIVEKHASCVYKHTITDGYSPMFIKKGGVTALSPSMTTPDFMSNLLRDFLLKFCVLNSVLAAGTFSLFLSVLKR